MDSFNEGAHAGHSSDDRLLQGEYKVDVSGFIRKAWKLFKQEPGKYIGFSFVLFAVYFIEQVFGIWIDPEKYGGAYQYHSPEMYPAMALGLIVISVFLSLLTIPLYVGFSIAGFRQMSDQQTEFGDFFHGYRYLASLIASALVQGIIVFAVIVVMGIVGTVIVMGFSRNTSHDDMTTILIFLMMLLCLVPLIYISVIYIFSQMLIVDRRLGFWQAMEMSRKVVNKQWFSVFGLVFIDGLLNGLGALALVAGLLVTVPVSQLTLVVAYKEIFGLQSSDW